jgi:GNAT superfamily N-acetyltransferase
MRMVQGGAVLDLATALLQRARNADPVGGVWEAGDVQWWSRTPRASDEVELPFWLDADGPVAGVLLTEWRSGWQCDVLSVPGIRPAPAELWSQATELLDRHARGLRVEVPLDPTDTELIALVTGAGFVADETDSTGWLDTADRQQVRALPDGFTLVDRALRPDVPHWMRERSGDAVAERLAACSLYDRALDLAVEAPDGAVAGYSLYWADPVTGAGLVEPVRVEEEFWRRGLAGAMLTEGIDRLAARGCDRVKISWGSEAAGALYRSVGFVPVADPTTWYAATWGESQPPLVEPVETTAARAGSQR